MNHDGHSVYLAQYIVTLGAAIFRSILVFSAVKKGTDLMAPSIAFVALNPGFLRQTVVFELLKIRFAYFAAILKRNRFIVL